MDNKKVGLFIAIQRKQKGMTQKELAEKIGVTNKAISKWETGQGYPDITTIYTLAEILGISTDELLNGELRKDDNKNVKVQSYNEIAKERISQSILRFKNVILISLVIAILGILFDFIFWHDYQKSIIMFVGNIIMIISVIIWFTGYNSLNKEVKQHNFKYPSEKIGINILFVKPFIISLWIWMFLPIKLIIYLFSINKNVYFVLDRINYKLGVTDLMPTIVICYIICMIIITVAIRKTIKFSS